MRSYARRAPALRVAGIRTVWRTLEDGEFCCPGCGGDRSYRRRTGRRRFVVLGVPILPRGEVAPVVECSSCRGHFGSASLDRPTTHHLAAMLRDAVHSVALAVLTAGGSGSRVTREAAVETVRAAGYQDCTADQLLTLLATLRASTPSAGVTTGEEPQQAPPPGDPAILHAELRRTLGLLAPHLESAGRESLLLQGAAIALADGPYQPAERDTLRAVGLALTISAEETERLLVSAHTPS